MNQGKDNPPNDTPEAYTPRGSGLVGFLACKSKVTPADFIVREKIALDVKESGAFRVYRLNKTGWNTVDALIRIAKESRLPLRDINYGGKKDRHGQTEQYITSSRELHLPESLKEAATLTQVGYSSEPMRPASIAGNNFTLVLRSLQSSETSHLMRNFESVQNHGFINYFDSQRFSTFDREEGLPARSLFAGDPEACLRQLLLGEFRREKSHAKDRKDSLRRVWGQWSRCENLAETAVETRVFAYLARALHGGSGGSTGSGGPRAGRNSDRKQQSNGGGDSNGDPGHFYAALELIPFEELLMMFSAFQAFLWNHLVARFIEEKSSRCARFKTRTGILAFPANLEEHLLDEVTELCLPGRGEVFDQGFRNRLNRLLKEEGLDVDCTGTAPLQSASMNAYMRRIRIQPADLSLSPFEDDELYPKRKKVTLSFTLPAGAYGTMLVKRLTLRARF